MIVFLGRFNRFEGLKSAIQLFPVSPSGKKRGHDPVAVFPVEGQLPGQSGIALLYKGHLSPFVPVPLP